MHDRIAVSRNTYSKAAVALVAALASLPALASGRDPVGLPAGAARPAYTAECGSCHLAYPPQLLAAGNWTRMMASLDRHFGVDASVDAAAGKAIAAYLAANAGPERRFGGDTLRISETSWFRHEHDEVPASAWKSPATKSASNCAACHSDAERGDYSERGVRMPVATNRSESRSAR